MVEKETGRESERGGEGNSEIAVLNALETKRKKGVQWSFRTCPSLVPSHTVSSYSQNRSRGHSGKSLILLLISCHQIQYARLSVTSRNSGWHTHLLFSSLSISSLERSVLEFHSSNEYHSLFPSKRTIKTFRLIFYASLTRMH